jgi:2-oxoglutarate dehydrogenase E1 component
VAVRLSGEDSVRGTFSQRHLTLHDREGGRSWTPLQHLSGADAPFEAYNSPLSEVATLGFEYGYSAVATDSLVAWEAQFGDFANVGQAVIDQFLVAGRSKWGQESRLTLLLPHAYEGQGPEHSSARLERFLQLGAEDNIRVAYPTTPAQHFHLLRNQVLREARRPLVLMTPKSLLRHPSARSPLEELAGGGFRPVLEEPGRDPAGTRRLLLCSGKVFYDLAESEGRGEAGDVAVVRLERLYPFPREEVRRTLEAHGPAEVTWVQEEPRNMGAWRHVRPYLRDLAGADPGYAGRPAMASPAEGYHDEHEEEQARIVRDAFAGPA